MRPEATAEAIEIEVHLSPGGGARMAREVRLGLTARPKELAPKYFYDERGSRLFERITELPEYYPTRAEREILAERSAEIVAAAGEPGTLVELGSGSAAKTRHLLDAMRDAGCLDTYVPVDISAEITHETARALVEEYPGLLVRGLTVFGSYARVLLVDDVAVAYAQFGPLSAYPRALHLRELYPQLPDAPLPAVITCIATTAEARGAGHARRLVEAQHTAELAQRVRYRDLPDGHVPGQLILPGTGTGTGTGSDGEASV